MQQTVTLDRFSAWVIQALEHYIAQKPKHCNGLCSWLTYHAPNTSERKGAPAGLNCYIMMTAVRRVDGCPKFEAYDMITEAQGYNERRAELAQFVIDALLTRKLRPVVTLDESEVVCWM